MKIVKTASKVFGLSLAAVLSAATMAQGDVNLDSEDSKIAYSIGVNIGQSVAAQGVLEGIDSDTFVVGMMDAIAGEVKLSGEEMFAAIQAFQQRMATEAQTALNSNLEASETFLAQNSAQDGVVTLASGLQYLVLNSGAAGAASPAVEDSVLAHYHGTLTDGTVFDSSVERGEPATFGLGQVIPGWTEALQLMKVGDKWRLFIPPSLAYGEQSPTPAIPPNSALIFDVELLEIR
ncbi:MAG: FKBP-type peptidyl-prolyl cis-trans isomerase FklB [Pseudohongiellaceae bacterium]|jgi:FKBP-type peptidyl-prolyl cis-trans isomerase FklB